MWQPGDRRWLLPFTVGIVLLAGSTGANEVFGCGGFIKNANSDLDFSKVEVGLYNPQGSLKIKTDCSPSNGYYFIPLYDKGDYVLKVIPPPGWSFEPEMVEIKFDGQTDICSQGKDVNFIFKGFGITGRVEIFGHTTGAKGVQVELRSESATKIGQTVTDSNGVFSFTPIKSGKYVIMARHDKWHFVQADYSVTVATGNTEIPANSLVVAGFDVQGSVFSDGQPFAGVGFLLYAAKNQKTIVNCPQDNVHLVPNGDKQFESVALCYTTPNKNTGAFVIPGVSTGRYQLRPHFTNTKIKFHIKPEALDFDVGIGSMTLPKNFEITGFSVSGRVLKSPNGPGVVNARIKLNGKEVAVTTKDGYMLDNIQAGTYTIQVAADDLQFKDQIVKVSLSNPALPDIIVSGFKVCGQVISKQSHRVSITKKASAFQTEVSTKEKTGEWCTYLENGDYSVQVLTSDEERASGIQFFPLSQSTTVNSSPVDGIVFSQLRATVTGEVQCLPDARGTCDGTSVTLNALDGSGNLVGQPTIAKAADGGRFVFVNVLPGSYEVSVPNAKLCWQSNTVRINIKSAKESVPAFIQTGYIVSVVSSHSGKMRNQLVGDDGPTARVDEIVLNAGLNTFCVKRYGEYQMKIIGCHRYDDATAKGFSTEDNSPTTITAKSHRNTVRLLSDEKARFEVVARKDSGAEERITFEAIDGKEDGSYVYQHEFYLEQGERVTLLPKSEIMLFNPAQLEVVGSNDCVDVPERIIATKGLLIDGRTNPPIKDVRVTLLFPNNGDLVPLVTETNDQGKFRFGPIDASLAVELSAEKESYVFSPFDRVSNTFSGHKLCEIIVTVKDSDGNKLPGVLLSLSGAESYRKNLVTGDDGTIKFHSLSPSEYYLRAMMKEYEFRPNSKLIEVKEGATVLETLVGTRTAFSIFGSITSLNGEPFPNVLVEAVTDDRCGNHLEEATSEFNGYYRIRGLQPNCQYRLRIRTSAPNSIVDRSIPRERLIDVKNGDIRDVNLIAISPLAFVDVTVRVVASENDFYKTLKVTLYKKGSESPVHTQRIESPLNVKSKINPGIMVFFPRIPFDAKTYYIELTTTLSDKNYQYSLPGVQFVANTSSYFTELHFEPELRLPESDLNQNSLSAIVLIAIIAFVFFKQELALELLGIVWGKLTSTAAGIVSRSKGNDGKSDGGYVDDRDIDTLASSINAIKKKKVKKVN